MVCAAALQQQHAKAIRLDAPLAAGGAAAFDADAEVAGCSMPGAACIGSESVSGTSQAPTLALAEVGAGLATATGTLEKRRIRWSRVQGLSIKC